MGVFRMTCGNPLFPCSSLFVCSLIIVYLTVRDFFFLSSQDISHMGHTLERLFDMKLQSMPKEVGGNVHVFCAHAIIHTG